MQGKIQISIAPIPSCMYQIKHRLIYKDLKRENFLWVRT